MAVADARDPHDVVTLLEMVLDGGAQAPVCAHDDDLGDLVWLGDAALRELDEQAERLAATFASRRQRKAEFRHAAYVQGDGSLVVVGQMAQGAFVFTVATGAWGWIRPRA